MKTKITILILTAIFAVSLILTGCSNDSEPNFGATGAKVYEPSLSAMSDEAIRIKVDELYDKLVGITNLTTITAYSVKIGVYQNELILRQLVALNADELGKQHLQNTKLGNEGLGHKQGSKGYSKNTLKGD